MKNVKDYIVPIVTFGLIFILIYVAFSGKEPTAEETGSTNTVASGMATDVIVGFNETDTKALYVDSSDKKHNLENGESISEGQTIRVDEGSISFTVPNIASLSLNKNGELIYGNNQKITLESSDLWVESLNTSTINTKFAKVMLENGAVVNIQQNELSTTVYVLKGTVEVENLAGVSTFLSQGKQIEISNKDASKDDIDLASMKQDFDDYFRISDWYLKNNGSAIVTDSLNTGNGNDGLGSLDDGNENDRILTGSLDNKRKTPTFSSLLSFDTIYDEGSVNTDSTNISGKFADESIAAVTIQGKTAAMNLETKTFNVLGVDTSKKSNDIIVKVFDEGENVIGKYVYTLYNNGGEQNTGGSDFSEINTDPYPVNGDDFIISIPTVKDGETYSSENTFYGTVKNPDVASVYVNGYKLKTYNGKTFRYHAYTRFKTLGEGVNNYEVKYVGKDGSVILKKYVTINKKNKAAEEKKKVISDEAKPE